jgi:hypothetical protein
MKGYCSHHRVRITGMHRSGKLVIGHCEDCAKEVARPRHMPNQWRLAK